MVNDEVEYLLERINELQMKELKIEVENYKLKKQNELLESRINLIENRPVPRHYNPNNDWDKDYQLDMYTLEYVYKMISKIIGYPPYGSADFGAINVRYKVWNLMSEDSKRWINCNYNPNEYYNED